MFDSEKTEQPTPKRRREAREKGQIAQSQDLSAVVLLLVALSTLVVVGQSVATSILDFSRSLWSGENFVAADASPEFWTTFFSRTVFYFLGRLFPFFLVLVLAGIAARLLQTGWLFLPEKLLPDPKRLNPLTGLGRIFSIDGFFRVGIGLVKVLISVLVVYFFLKNRWETVLTLGEKSSWEIVRFLSDSLISVGLKITFALLVLAGLDFLFQRWKLERDLRMTPQEIREELRETLGNPEVAAKRKQLRQRLAQQNGKK